QAMARIAELEAQLAEANQKAAENDDVFRAQFEEMQRVEAERDEAQDHLDFQRYWYGCRFERLREFVDAELAEPLRMRYYSIVANGTADTNEPPTYAQQFNMLKHRAEAAEAEAAKLRCICLEEAENLRQHVFQTELDTIEKRLRKAAEAK